MSKLKDLEKQLRHGDKVFIAELIGKSEVTIKKYFSGDRSNPHTLQQIITAAETILSNRQKTKEEIAA